MARGFALPTASGVVFDTATVGNDVQPVNVVGIDADAVGGAVKFRLREKTVSGLVICTVSLVDGESVGDWWPGGKYCNGDLYFQLVSGTGSNLTGTVWVA